ncbi:hydantoinase B/oxoprolinase family protein [Ramlibacter sp. AW1]|uniref:Hydantoinase B/oxoprolinase family protein n=1 Tax=Ramlibacter aurantiacus TaxID=2801330 RepID=A0A936ZG82_9BURK|nr:hydantoinase B/oxoprolinase family protein [Ramlibacter aurantiacus]MBL0419312.1 hydantoinase B/oxoprolinase family protein [Ramlibacter aurantiacus]
MNDEARPGAIDPITLEVIRCGLVAIANQLDANIARTAYSPIVYEYKDYAVGILDAEGRLICQCTGGIPIFIADIMGVAIRDGLSIHGAGGIRQGDVIISNHAGTIGQHLNNVVMYTPAFHDASEQPVAFVAIVMHWMDIGGRAIGSVSMHATDIFQEGIQFRSVKLHAADRRCEDIYRIIECNTRFPGMVLGDIEAQVAGCRMGRALVETLVARYGLDTFRCAVDTIWDQSEASARAAIGSVPDGTYSARVEMDDDGTADGGRLPIEVHVRVESGVLTVDLTRLPDEVAAPINSGAHGGAHTCARIAFKYLFAPEEAANEGTFRPLRLELRQGSLLSASSHAAMGRYNAPMPTVIDAIIRALEPAMPGQVAGGHFGTFASVQFVGRQPKTRALFQCNDSGHGGWGATQGHDGSGPFRTMAHGDTRIVPTEVQEALYPLRIDEFSLRQDSGGAGEFRGGLGLCKRYEILGELTLVTYFERTASPPWGVCGGGEGAVGQVLVAEGGREPVPMLKGERALAAGDRVVVLTGGGGGYGPPPDRRPEKIAEDLRLGYVSPDWVRKHHPDAQDGR